MNIIKNLACVGGDLRRDFMVSRLNGYGYNTDILFEIDDNMSFYDGFILPLPLTTDGVHINSTKITINEFIDKIPEGKIIFTGKTDNEVKNRLINKKLKVYDYFLRDEFSLKNAEPTALGVLKYVLNNSLKTVSGVKLLVVGYGKCAESVSRVFRNLGADVTAASRRYLTVAKAQADGIGSYLIKELKNTIGEFDLIVNTVPFPVINKPLIDCISKEAMIIDISSAPYGFDYDYAKMSGKKIIMLPSLPGKCFPETAGNIIADTILNIIEEGDFE